MIKAKYKLLLKDWIEIGKTCKQLREMIMELQCNPDLQSRMTKKERDGLWKMGVGLADFTNHAEEVMYREYSEQFTGTREWLNVFYGEAEAKL